MVPKILQLFRANAGRPRDRRAVAAAAGQNASIYIYDVIGYDWWTDAGITAEWFQSELQRLGVGAGDVVDVYIDSPGGDVFEARAMIAAMNRSPAQFHMHVDGLAASAASFFAMHGDRVDIIQGGFLMIHNSWTMAIGDRHDMEKQAQLLAQIDNEIARDYEQRTGIKRAELAQMMDDETWLDAETAVAKKFADSVQAKPEKAPAKSARWDLSAYARAPAALTDHPPEPAPDMDAAIAAHNDRMRRFALLSRTPA